jgi:hypothetical protein
MEDPSRACVAGPLEPFAEGFTAELARLGYTSGSAYRQMLLMAHVSRWLAGEGLGPGGLTPEAVDRFLAHRRAVGYGQLLSPRALVPLLGFLRRIGAAPEAPPPVPAGPADALLARYRCYLVTERGVGAATAADYAAKTRSFVAARQEAEGLSEGLSRWRAPRAVHDPGKIIADLAAAVALGGDCLADIAVLREQPGLAGPVASDPVVSRLVTALAGDLPRALRAIRSARAAARERAWALAGDAAPGADGGLVTIDLDATIVVAHSEKEQAAPTWKKTFGLLTELAKASFLFSRHVASVFITVAAHGR